MTALAQLEDDIKKLEDRIFLHKNRIDEYQKQVNSLQNTLHERHQALERCVIHGLALEQALKAALDYIDLLIDPTTNATKKQESYCYLNSLNPRSLIS